MKYMLCIIIIECWLVISAGAFIARGFSQGTTLSDKKTDTLSPLDKEIIKLKKKNQILDDSVARYKIKDSVVIEERKEIVKNTKQVGNKLKVASKKADDNLKTTVLQGHRTPAMYITVPKPREVLLLEQRNVKPLDDTVIKVERTFWDKMFFRKKHKK